MIKDAAILNTSYFPPIQYITKFIIYQKIIIEVHDSYQKQTYRNRCNIYSPNGIQSLSIPVTKRHGAKTLSKDIKISYSEKWQINHLRSIEAAYRSTPFYEYYFTEVEAILLKEHVFLLDLNSDIINLIFSALEIDLSYELSDDYLFNRDHSYDDYRGIITPKVSDTNLDSNFSPKKYYQVFDQKFGFIPNLSIIDLIFNEGPNSLEIIQASIS